MNHNQKMKEEKDLEWRYVTPHEFEDLPEVPGVYIISTLQRADDHYEVKYVGQAENLQARAKEHWSKHETNESLKKHIHEKFAMKFSFLKVGSKEERDGLELYLYNTFDPLLNHRKPPGETPIKCDLPMVRKHH